MAKGTANETVFTVTGKTVNSLTGVARLRGANVNLDATTPVTVLNNQEFVNQYENAAQSAEAISSLLYAADGGSTDAYVVSLDPAPTAYSEGMTIVFKANTANTGAATLNVNSLGEKTIKKLHDQDLTTNDIEAGQIVMVVYDGTNFQLLTDLPTSNALATDLNIASQAQGDIIYFNGTNWVRLGAGTNGQFLKTQGTGANPTWGSPSVTTKILQVVSVANTTTRSTTSSTFSDITGASVDITVSANSRLLVSWCANISMAASGKYGYHRVVAGGENGSQYAYLSYTSDGLAETSTISGVYRTSALTAGAKTVKLQFNSFDNATALYSNNQFIIVMEEAA